MKKKVIAVDFDSTLFTEVFPGVGDPILKARDVINSLYHDGHTIIINTCREGIHAVKAKEALKSHGYKYHYFNVNDPERIARYGDDPRKIGSDMIIDDKCLLSLVNGKEVDWDATKRSLDIILGNKKKVVCIVGESGSGKTHLANYLQENHGIQMIESYTDRPKRHDNEKGHTFLTKQEFDNLDMRRMIAFTCWIQAGGDIGRYCCLDSDVTDDVMTYVIDERGLQYLRKYWSQVFTIFAVRMFAPDHMRKEKVGEERVSRDEGNYGLGPDAFDYFIDNDYTDSMANKYESLYKRILEL